MPASSVMGGTWTGGVPTWPAADRVALTWRPESALPSTDHALVAVGRLGEGG